MQNGHDLKDNLKARTVLGGVQQAEKFGELQFRQMLQAVERMAKMQGGQVPLGDPMVILSLGVVMEMLNDISARLTKLESPQPAAEPAEVFMKP